MTSVKLINYSSSTADWNEIYECIAKLCAYGQLLIFMPFQRS